MGNLIHVFRSIGFDDKQSALYLAGLKMGSSSASDIAKKSGLNRVTAYNTPEGDSLG